jgi:hypothetical protein
VVEGQREFQASRGADAMYRGDRRLGQRLDGSDEVEIFDEQARQIVARGIDEQFLDVSAKGKCRPLALEEDGANISLADACERGTQGFKDRSIEAILIRVGKRENCQTLLDL